MDASHNIVYHVYVAIKLCAIIIITNYSAVEGWECVRTLYNSEDPTLDSTNLWKKEKEKIVRDKKKEQIKPTRKHWLCS